MPSGSRKIGPLGLNVALLLHRERRGRGVTLRLLSERTGVTVSQLSRMLNGSKVMTVDEFCAICGALGCDPAEVIRAVMSTLDVPGVVCGDDALEFETP